MLRSCAAHRAAPEPNKRTAVVENARVLGPLFPYNNLHVAHHMRGGLPWYQVPTLYRLNRAALIERGAVAIHVSAMPPRSPDRDPSWPCGRAR